MGLGTLVGSFLLELTVDSFRLLFGGFVCFTPTFFLRAAEPFFSFTSRAKITKEKTVRRNGAILIYEMVVDNQNL